MPNNKYRVSVPTVDAWRAMIKCQAACPVFTDARGYVTAAARGDLELGYQIAHDPNPLSTICGRICGAPCEDACRRSDVSDENQPVAIRPIKRVLTERYGPESQRYEFGDPVEAISGTAPEQAHFFSPNPLIGVTEVPDIPGEGAPTDFSTADR
ncbi:MAG: hypothetical protein P1P76_04320 [Anaerolineales bacterium]|nr:hypothetical protein [Anaerolineales bacterium]